MSLLGRLRPLSAAHFLRACHISRTLSTMRSFPAAFVRGGTSTGLVVERKHLPHSQESWPPILSSAMGSPDPYARQLDGMGSGVSSTSKIMIIDRSTRDDADIDYTFVQVGIKDGSLDMAGNCGNLSSAVGPVAWDKILRAEQSKEIQSPVTVRLFNTNTSKIIHATFDVDHQGGRYEPCGDYAIDGVPGHGSRVTLSFVDPAGSKTAKAFPTGNVVDSLTFKNGDSIRATLSDIANPGVFVLASDLHLLGEVTPDELQANIPLVTRLEEIRRAGATAMGLNPDVQSIPKIVLLFPPGKGSGVDIVCRALSMQQAHKAVPLTHALNLGSHVRMAGTLAHDIARPNEDQESIVLGHASGKLEVGSVIRDRELISAVLHRTTRTLMEGNVFYMSSED